MLLWVKCSWMLHFDDTMNFASLRSMNIDETSTLSRTTYWSKILKIWANHRIKWVLQDVRIWRYLIRKTKFQWEWVVFISTSFLHFIKSLTLSDNFISMSSHWNYIFWLVTSSSRWPRLSWSFFWSSSLSSVMRRSLSVSLAVTRGWRSRYASALREHDLRRWNNANLNSARNIVDIVLLFTTRSARHLNDSCWIDLDVSISLNHDFVDNAFSCSSHFDIHNDTDRARFDNANHHHTRAARVRSCSRNEIHWSRCCLK